MSDAAINKLSNAMSNSVDRWRSTSGVPPHPNPLPNGEGFIGGEFILSQHSKRAQPALIGEAPSVAAVIAISIIWIMRSWNIFS